MSLRQNLQGITESLTDILMFKWFSYSPSEKQYQERNDPVSDINIKIAGVNLLTIKLWNSMETLT